MFQESNFINIGERCNVAGSSVFKKLIMADKFSVSFTVLMSHCRFALLSSNPLIGQSAVICQLLVFGLRLES